MTTTECIEWVNAALTAMRYSFGASRKWRGLGNLEAAEREASNHQIASGELAAAKLALFSALKADAPARARLAGWNGCDLIPEVA